jgi:heptosyltransferase-3
VKKILVVVTRRIGDVLLSTPLIRSLRRAFPDSEIDALVFEGTEGVLSGNPDVNQVVRISQRMKFIDHLAFLAKLRRKYDLALSLIPGDRPTLYACIAGRESIGLVNDGREHLWKKKLLSKWIPFDNLDTHTVSMNLALAEAIGVKPCHDVVASWKPEDESPPCDQPYAVLHVYPMYAYKMWKKEAWIELAQWLERKGLRIVLTGGKNETESEYIASLLPFLPQDTIDLSGKLSLGGVAHLLSRASAYVGPDTAVTHMAASTGIPTVALFGPSNPVKWGPWPKGYEGENPYVLRGTQRVGNVILLQGKGDCVPCMEEGCERNINSESACLQNLPARDAIAALEELMK